MKSVKEVAGKIAHDYFGHVVKFLFRGSTSMGYKNEDKDNIVVPGDLVRILKRRIGLSFDQLSKSEQAANIESGCKLILEAIEKGPNKDLSDGYHTFDELYEFRKLYNAALFNEWAKDYMAYFNDCYENNKAFLPEMAPVLKWDVHKSRRHNDGELCFGGGWFIVVAVLPGGQISNHYKEEDWDLFKIPSFPMAKYKWDGHTSSDVMDRLAELCGK